MKFQLSDKVRLRGENRQWVLERHAERRRSGKAVTEYKPLGFYSSISAAIRSAAEYDERMASDWADLHRRWDRLFGVMNNELRIPLDALEESALVLQAWWAKRENTNEHS